MPRGSGIRHCGYCYKTGHNKRTCPSRSDESKARGANSASKRRCGWCYNTGHNLRTCATFKQLWTDYLKLIGAYRRRVRPLLVKAGLGRGALIAAPGKSDRGYVDYDEHPYGSGIKGQDVFLVRKIEWAQIAPIVLLRATSGDLPGGMPSIHSRAISTHYTDGIERTGWKAKFETEHRGRLPVDSAFMEYCTANDIRPRRSGAGKCDWFVLAPAPGELSPPALWASGMDNETAVLVRDGLKTFMNEHSKYAYTKTPENSPHESFVERLNKLTPHYVGRNKNKPMSFPQDVFVRYGCEDAIAPYAGAWKSM